MLTPVILATAETEIKRTVAGGQPLQTDLKTPSQVIKSWAWWV
jgi:hypothetical protein